MKRALISFILLFTVFSVTYAKEDLFSFSVGPQSGLVFYGDDELKESLKGLSGSHIIVGALAEVNVNPFKQVTFYISAEALCDFVKNGKYHSNNYHVDFPFGIKIYPGLGGLCAGLGYTFGFRYQNIQLPEAEPKKGMTSFGNGCKFLLEYNFAHDYNSRYLPTLGASWKFIPRGNNQTDHLISAYVLINL